METMKVGYETSLNEYIQQERTAVKLTNSIGHLMFEKGVELVFFRNHMVDISISELLNLFEYAKNVVEKPLEIDLVNDVVEELYKMDLAPSKIDIGKLSNEYLEQAQTNNSISSFLKDRLKNFIGEENHNFSPQDVILYGFGRIGRIAARELFKQAVKGQQ